jgi:Protein of unknown function (DUF2846)
MAVDRRQSQIQARSRGRRIPANLSRRLLQAGSGAVMLAGVACSQLPTTASVTVPPIPAGEARMWFYRNDGIYESQMLPHVRMNDRLVGEMAQRSALYRDVAPGHYHVAVDSYVDDRNGSRDVDLAPGQQVYFKIVSSSDFLSGGLGDPGHSRPAFYIWLIPAAWAQGEVAISPFYGGG